MGSEFCALSRKIAIGAVDLQFRISGLKDRYRLVEQIVGRPQQIYAFPFLLCSLAEQINQIDSCCTLRQPVTKKRRTPNKWLPVGNHQRGPVDKGLEFGIVPHHHERGDVHGA